MLATRRWRVVPRSRDGRPRAGFTHGDACGGSGPTPIIGREGSPRGTTVLLPPDRRAARRLDLQARGDPRPRARGGRGDPRRVRGDAPREPRRALPGAGRSADEDLEA